MKIDFVTKESKKKSQKSLFTSSDLKPDEFILGDDNCLYGFGQNFGGNIAFWLRCYKPYGEILTNKDAEFDVGDVKRIVKKVKIVGITLEEVDDEIL